MLGGNLGSLLYGDVSVMYIDPVSYIQLPLMSKGHFAGENEMYKWCLGSIENQILQKSSA